MNYVMSERCPSRIVLHRIGVRRTVFILNALEDGPVRSTALVGHIRGDHAEGTVRFPEGPVMRLARASDRRNAGPAHVEYELTDLGISLLLPLRTVRLWAEEHAPDVIESRAPWSAGDQ